MNRQHNNRGGDYGNRPRPDTEKPINKELIKQVIEKGFNSESMTYAEEVGKEITKVTTSQIRNAYGELTRIKMKSQDSFKIHDLLMLKPKLAYAVGRASSHQTQYKYLANNLIYAIDVVATVPESEVSKAFQNFASFFEAVLAYHRANGGK